MSRLPFLFNAGEFHPLQPEDVELETMRRSDPRYVGLYRNVAEERYAEVDPAPPVEDISSYEAWVATCRAMDEEVASAKRAWHAAVVKKDTIVAELRAECERARIAYRTLELRVKPPQPKSAKGKKP